MLNKVCNIGDQLVAPNSKRYVIAEVGSNSNQDLNTAKRLIDIAMHAKANAVKFQLFKADVLYPNQDGLYEVFKTLELNPTWVPILSKYALRQGIEFMASAFDKESVDILESVEVPAHKVASSEVTDLAFVHYVASKGRPVIISTGMCDMVDVEEVVNVCLAAGNSQVIPLQCGSLYPLPADQVHLRVISTLQDRFSCPVGFSDHTRGQIAATTAVALGAAIFEKHFTLDRSMEGPDHFYALEPDELSSYVAAIHEAHESLGSPLKNILPDEKTNGRRKGLYATRNLIEGETISPTDLIEKRPALGIRGRYYSLVIGATLTRPILSDEPIFWDAITFITKK